MEKKFKFSDRPMTVKLIYAVAVAILCITAIIVGIVAAASKPQDTPDDTPPAVTPDDGGNNNNNQNETPEPKPLAFISPLVGTVTYEHDLTTPVFSNTLGAWKVHAGIDISADEGASIYASEAGVVSAIYSDPMLGYTVELTHEGGIKTRYSNLANTPETTLKVGDKLASGDVIGVVGDTSTSELAEEPHLHFEVLVDGKKVDPLDYITKESKKASLGIEE